MKTLEQLIEEHNKAMQQAEEEYVDLRDAIISILSRQFEQRREHISYRMRLFDEISKYCERTKKLDEMK